MGWWKIDTSSTQDLYMGDEPLDIVTDMLANLSYAYEQDIGRKPVLAELMRAVEICLGAAADEYLSDCGELEIVALRAQTRKRKKKQTYNVGDFFAIPLGHQQYGFGRILEKSPLYGLLIVVFNVTSQRIPRPGDLRGKPLLSSPIYCSEDGLEEWRWKVIGSMPLDPGEYPAPRFKLGGLLPGEGWRVWQNYREYPATAEEVAGLEKLALWSREGVEEKIKQALL